MRSSSEEVMAELSTSEEPDGIRQMFWYLVLALMAIIIGGLSDLLLDRPKQWLSAHVLFELMLIMGAAAAFAFVGLSLIRARHAMSQLQHSLESRKQERDAWKESAQRALEGFAAAIDSQFLAWGLTPAEREVALLLLKGYSHKHIARDTNRSERTVRQHAATAYQKAGVTSRAELSAFFLEDLMLPK